VLRKWPLCMKEYHVAVGGTHVSLVRKITGILYLSPRFGLYSARHVAIHAVRPWVIVPVVMCYIGDTFLETVGVLLSTVGKFRDSAVK
jgi:hypothetical protein